MASIGPTLVGGGLTLLGVLITLVWTGHRDRQRETESREHERETWARDLRYQSHVAFLTEFTAKSDAIDANEANYPDGDGPDPSYDWLLPVWNRYQALRLVSQEATLRAAQAAVFALSSRCFNAGRWEDVEYRLDLYLGAIRAEFGLPSIPLMGDD